MECLTSASQSCGGSGPAAQLFVHLLSSLLTAQCGLRASYPADASNSIARSYDYIVVGAGSAGSALAAGLAANPDWSVLLVEAGGDPPLNSDIPGMLWSVGGTYADWQFETVAQEDACGAMTGRRSAWSRGKMMGGTSSMNAMLYQVGIPEDYDAWEALGNAGWGWKDVKGYFQSQLRYVNRDNPLDDGLRNRLFTAARETGVGVVTDPVLKSMGYVGYRQTYLTTMNNTRNNAARIFLVPIANRTNLHVIKHSLVGKVLIDSDLKHAQGVEVFIGGKKIRITARREVILSAGTVNSPQLLMLSGIGPKDHLQSLGIPVVADLPVGEHLLDHSTLLLAYKINASSNDGITPDDEAYEYLRYRRGFLAALGVSNTLGFVNTSSNTSRYPDVEIHHIHHSKNDISSMSPNMTNIRADILADLVTKVGEKDVLLLFIALLHAESYGWIRLKSTDPFDKPLINPRYNAAEADVQTLLRGVRFASRFMQTDALRAEWPELVRPDLPDCDQLEFNTEAYWRCYIRYFTTTMWHPVGSVPMGTVLDAQLRVRGISGLRVADASIMPSTISGNTNAASMMIGQKAADLIRKDWRTPPNWDSYDYFMYR